jgi:flagellar hook protein FlgE
MMRSMFSAVSGLKVHQTALDVTANDIANVNTIGYRASRATFEDVMSQTQRAGSGPSGIGGGSNPLQVGLGVKLGSVDALMGQGALQTTGNPLDVAIQGEGWLRVGTSVAPAVPANISYTRSGNLAINSAGYLTTQEGNYVIGRTAAGGGTDTLIQIPAGGTNVSIGQDGSVTYQPAGGGAVATAGFISLAKFSNQAGLQRTSSSLWSANPASGAEQVNTPGAAYGITVSSSLEMSNVDLATEFTSMITAQRGFQANSRVITTADEMLQDLVNLKR